MSILRANTICLNCLKPGHFSKSNVPVPTSVRSVKGPITEQPTQRAYPNVTITNGSNIPEQSTANVITGVSSSTLLMTCQLMINALMAIV